jgi:hypothetical protein
MAVAFLQALFWTAFAFVAAFFSMALALSTTSALLTTFSSAA